MNVSEEFRAEDEEARFQEIARDVKSRQRSRYRFRSSREIVARVVAAHGISQIQANAQLQSAWEEAAGAAIARRSRLGPVRRGVLTVELGSSVLAQEVEFSKRELIRRLTTLVPDAGIRQLRCRVGSFE